MDQAQIALMAKTIILKGHLHPREGDPPDGRLLSVEGVEGHLLYVFLRSSINQAVETVLAVVSYTHQGNQTEQTVWMYVLVDNGLLDLESLVTNGFLKPNVRYWAVPRYVHR